MTHAYDRFLVKAFQGQAIQDILDASPAALRGVSTADAQALNAALGITTVRDLAATPFFRRALAILAGSGSPAYDPGPPPAWEAFFAAAPLDYFGQHPSSRFRLDFGPVYYRGRLDGSARVIVVGQDPAMNEILGHRVFVGRSGQRIQGFLSKVGLTRSYAMLNAFLYSVFGQFDAVLRAISLEGPILSFRNAFLDRLVQGNSIQAVIAVGNGAQHALQHWPGGQNLPLFEITHPAAHDESALLDNWNQSLLGLRAVVDADDDGQPGAALYGASFQPQDQVPIPRYDLPFGLPDWHGDGSHGTRQGNKEIVWIAP